MIAVKLCKVDDASNIRRVNIAAGPRCFDRLKSAVSATFPEVGVDFQLKWVDPEQDECTIASDMELLEAVNVLQGQTLKLLIASVASTPVPSSAPAAAPGKPEAVAPVKSETKLESGADISPAAVPTTDIHEGINCDNCGVKPIQGTRYKCTVCNDFDLCECCEAQGVHPADHPL